MIRHRPRHLINIHDVLRDQNGTEFSPKQATKQPLPLPSGHFLTYRNSAYYKNRQLTYIIVLSKPTYCKMTVLLSAHRTSLTLFSSFQF